MNDKATPDDSYIPTPSTIDEDGLLVGWSLEHENKRKKSKQVGFLADDPATISNTSICLILKAEPGEVKAIVDLLANENVAFDIGSYRDAPAGIRIWGGATVEASDLEALMPWIAWAYEEVLNK